MITQKRLALPLLFSLMLALSACGNTRHERAGSGAVIGGGAGFVAGGLCCGNPGNDITTGFFVGAAVGALIGFILNHPLFFDTRENR